MDELGDPEEFYKRAMELNDKEPIAYSALGDLYFSQKKYQEAVNAYGHASELVPTQPYYAAQLAHSYSGMGEHESAIQTAQQLLKQISGDRDAHGVLGVVYFNASRYGDAIEHLQIDLDDDTMEVRSSSTKQEAVFAYLLVRAYAHEGQQEESKALIKKITGA